MSANFTPTRGTYTELKPFRYWCQKVLPLVYDDSLSYYELLCKVVDYLNKTMEDVETLHDDMDGLYTAYSALQTYVNTYFDSLDITTEIDAKLDKMALDGTLEMILWNAVGETTPEIVSEWLQENISQETGYVLDDSLSVADAAADAKAVGDNLASLRNTLKTASNMELNYAAFSTAARTHNGVTFTCKDGNVRLYGTSTNIAYIDMFDYANNPLEFPFEAGKSYAVRFYQDGTGDQIQKQILWKQTSDDTDRTYYTSSTSEDIVILNMPDAFYDMRLRLVAGGTGLAYTNKTVHFSIIELINANHITDFDEGMLDAWSKGGFVYNNLFPSKGYNTTLYYGCTITNDDGIHYHVSGTASHTVTYMLLEDKNNKYFKPNQEIVVQYTNPGGKLYLEIVPKLGSTSLTPVLQRIASGIYKCKFPATFDYVRVNIILESGTTYNEDIAVVVKTSGGAADPIIVDASGGGDYTKLKDGIAEAILTYGRKVIVKPGEYDLVEEFGESYLDDLDGGDYGIMLGNGVEVYFAPNAYVTFDYDGANTWIIQNFSPFNTANDLGYTLDGLHCVARNCRYLLHDDPRPGVKDRYSHNVIRNCYLEMYSSPAFSDWVNHQIIGGGFGDATIIDIENNIFVIHLTGADHYNAVSYHNSTSGSADYESRVTVKDNYFGDGCMVGFYGYGDATSKSKAVVTNNSLERGDTDITYNTTDGDNIQLYKWNNVDR